MVRHHVVRVGKAPSGGGEVRCQKVLLSPYEQAGLEATDLEVGRAPDDGGAGQEPEHRRTREVRLLRQRAAGHLFTNGVLSLPGTDEDAGDQQAKPGMGVEEVRGAGQGARSPPRVVVGEGHVWGSHGLHAHVTARGAEVLVQRDHLDLGVALAHGGDRTIGGGVVHDDDARALRQGAEMSESVEEIRDAVPRYDDHPDARVSGVHGHPETSAFAPGRRGLVGSKVMRSSLRVSNVLYGTR